MSETADSILTAPTGTTLIRQSQWWVIEDVALTGAEFYKVWLPESDDERRMAASLRVPSDEDLALIATDTEPMS